MTTDNRNSENEIDDIDEAEFADLPSTDIEVHVHVHFGMTGTFPLRLVDLFFADDGLYIVEYGYITPLFGLGTKKHSREASAMQTVYDYHGLDEVMLQGDSVTWLSYTSIEQIAIYKGGRFGRPKIAVYPREGSSHAYRLHDEPVLEELRANVKGVAEHHGITVEYSHNVGFSPIESLQRFFSQW